MKLVVWLWNPWEKYQKTRHNLWFMFLDFLKEIEWFENFKFDWKFKWEISVWIIWWEKTILLKPQTFMNLSWKSIREVLNFYKIDIKNLIVVYDDMSMEFWKIRFRNTWTAWWHNGIKSIINYFWENFKRIKVWVWQDERYNVSDWVLSKFKKDEKIELDDFIFDKVLIKLKQEI